MSVPGVRPAPYLRQLDRLLNDYDAGAVGPKEMLRALTGHRNLWWNCCRDAVRNDPGWLFEPRTTSLVRLMQSLSAPAGQTPDGVSEAVSVILAVARAIIMQRWPNRDLAASDQPDPELPAETGAAENAALRELERPVEHWHGVHPLPAAPTGGALVTDIRLRAIGEAQRHSIDAIVRHLETTAAHRPAAMVVLTALLLAATETRRLAVRVPVVFGLRNGSGHGVTGTLVVEEFVGGPAGAYPDPRTMGVFRADASFWGALGTAWHLAPSSRNARCVIWRVLLDDGSPVAAVDGGSLGAAFAIALRELFRSRDGWFSTGPLRRAFRGIRPGIALTGGVNRHGDLTGVGHMDDKARAAKAKRLQLVAPEENSSAAVRTRYPETVRFAKNVKAADRLVRRWRVGRMAVAAALLLAPAGTGYTILELSQRQADQQQQQADRQRLASRLVELSGTLRQTNVGLAQLFAVEAYRLDPGSQARSALFRSLTASPRLVRMLQLDGTVSTMTSAADGNAVALGTRDGRVLRWRLDTGDRTTVLQVPGPVTDIATDARGTAVVATDGTEVRRWTEAGGAHRLEMPNEQKPVAIGISPSGSFTVVAGEDRTNDAHLSLFDGTGRRSAETELIDFYAQPTHLAVPTNQEVVLLDGGYGTWERRSLPAFERLGGSTVGFGVHNAAAALSADGNHFSYTNRGAKLPIWTANGAPDLEQAEHTATTRGQDPSGLALSRNGSRLALVDGSTIHVSTVVASGATAPPPESLTGSGTITSVMFLGRSNDQLLSASGDVVTLWDLRQHSRISRQMATRIPSSCNSCGGPQVSVRPDGRYAAVVDGNGIAVSVLDLQPPFATRGHVRADLLSSPIYGPPLWTRDGKSVMLISPRDGSAQIRDPESGLRLTGRWPAPPNELQLPDTPASVAFSADGEHVVEIDASATIKVRDSATGQIRQQFTGPRSMAPTADGYTTVAASYVALDASASRAAVVNESDGQVILTEIPSGRTRTIPLTGVSAVAFLGAELLIQRAEQPLELWSFADATKVRTLQGTANRVVDLVSNETDLIVMADAASSATVIDATSGDTLGTFPLPTGGKIASTSLAFAPDRKTLLVATEADGIDAATGDIGHVITWSMEDAAWLRSACLSAGHDLTPQQWQQHVRSPAPDDLECLR